MNKYTYQDVIDDEPVLAIKYNDLVYRSIKNRYRNTKWNSMFLIWYNYQLHRMFYRKNNWDDESKPYIKAKGREIRLIIID